MRRAGPLGVFLVALCSGHAGASITIDLVAETRVDLGREMALGLTATNTGTEAARDVEPDVVIDLIPAIGQPPRRGEAVPELGQGASHTWTFTLPPPTAPGFLPIAIRVRYADTNGYALSALLVHVARTAAASAGPVRPTLEPETIATDGTLHVRLENPGPRPADGRVVAILPAEFRAEPESLGAQVPAGGRVDVTLAVQNTGALAGSSYPAYVVFEYEWNGVRQAALAQSQLTVIAASPPSPLLRWLAVAAAVAIGIAMGGVLVRALVRRGDATA
jgi:hypothetical protein